MHVFTSRAVYIHQKHPEQDKRTIYYCWGGNLLYFGFVSKGFFAIVNHMRMAPHVGK